MFKNKKIIVFALVVCMLMCSFSGNILAQESDSLNCNDAIGMRNIAIRNNFYNFEINENGNAVCISSVEVGNDYTVKLTMQLQQKTGMWKTINSWTNRDSYYVAFDETYQVEKGYEYRLMVVYIAYDSNGNEVESFYDLSNVVRYE